MVTDNIPRTLSSKPATFHSFLMPSRPGPLSSNHACCTRLTALGCEEPGPQAQSVETTSPPNLRALNPWEFDFMDSFRSVALRRLRVSRSNAGASAHSATSGAQVRAVAQGLMPQLSKG